MIDSLFVEKTRAAITGLKEDADKRAAMVQVVEECIRDGILTDFLTERKEEVIMTSILNYDQAAHEWALHADGYDEGQADGYEKGRAEERKNTEAERRRADEAEARVRELEMLLKEKS